MQDKNIRYVQIKAGNLKNYKIVEEDLKPLSENKIRIQVKAVGLNFADIFACLGLYSATPKGSFSPGLEFSGIITEIGKNVKSNFQIGDEVIGTTRFGALSNYVDVSSSYLYPKPKEWSFEEAASFFVQSLTAWYGLVELGRLNENSYVLLQSAAGGVGLHALQILHHFNAKYCAIVGSPKKIEILKSYGVDQNDLLIRNNRVKIFFKDLQNHLKQHKKRGFDIVFDAVSGKFFKPQFQLLNRGGIYVIYGAADLMSNSNKPNYLWLAYKYLTFYRVLPLNLIDRNYGIFGFNLIWLYDKIELFQRMIREMQKINWKKPHIAKIFDFKDSYDALKFLQSGESTGKVVIKF